MPDPYARIAEARKETVDVLSGILEMRAQEPAMATMRKRYLGWLDLPSGSHAAELGCGPGDVTADLIGVGGIESAVGIDPSAFFVERARSRFGDNPRVAFEIGDARSTQFESESFELVVMHTTLCHVPEPDRALKEAARILRPGGTLALFDGDYATGTAAIGKNDPLQSCVDAFFANYVENLWLCRTIESRIAAAGLTISRTDAHPYLAGREAGYFLTIVDRGAGVLVRDGSLSEGGAEALKSEAAGRVADGSFFGFISFISVLARKPVD